MATMTQAAKPLNATLYAFLQHKFKDVRIANQGAAAVVRKIRDPVNPGRTITQGLSWGEYYCVNCPFCNDVGNKLWINHTYGADVNSLTGKRADTHLAVCYKNNCVDSPERREQLETLIFGPGRRFLSKIPIAAGDPTTRPEVIEPPGTIVSLVDLPETDPAIRYLRSRSFDVSELVSVFDLGVCLSPTPRFAAMRGRIYIPSYFNGTLVAWQGRAPTAQKIDMKYYTAGVKSRALYNYDVAKNEPAVVIVEGAPSVWRIGRYAVSLFGKSLSFWQENTIATTWAGKPVFVVFDYGEEQAAEKAAAQLCRHNLSVVPVVMPDERDPADYTREEFFELLYQSSADCGVNLNFNFMD